MPACPGLVQALRNAGEGLPPAMDDAELWQEAQDRVLLYLKKLGMPAILSLEIAHEALGKAAEEASTAGGRPLVLAMRALHMILARESRALELTPYAKFAVLYRRWHPEQPTERDACTVTDWATGREKAALPPIRRETMTVRRI